VQNKSSHQKKFCKNLKVVLHFRHSRLPTVPMIELQPTTEHKLPFDLSDEQPKTHKDGIAIAVNTTAALESLGPTIDFADKDLHSVAEVIKGVDKPLAPRHIQSAAEAKAASVLIQTFDFQAFADIQQARTFITNKLVKMTDCGDPKVEIKALELLGKHSDIGLFTERSEITVHHTTSKGLEDSIKERIKRLMNVEITDVTPLDDLDTLLGPAEETREDVPESNEQSDT
jgi:hypothetical protein